MNLDDFGTELIETYQRTLRDAENKKYTLITPEFLLLHLLADFHVGAFMDEANVNVSALAKDLRNHITEHPDEFQIENVRLPNPFLDKDADDIIVTATKKARRDGRLVNGIDLLTSFYSAGNSSYATACLRKYILPLDVVHVRQELEAKMQKMAGKIDHLTSDQKASESKKEASALEKYCIDIMAKVREGGVDPLIGRDDEVTRMIQVLGRRRKNNPILVGESGVGKTAIAEGLATKILNGEVPDDMKRDQIYALDLGTLVAGAKYRGDFEQRLKQVVSELKQQSAAKLPVAGATRKPKVHLLIDEIHTMIGAGAASGGVMDASNLLKPSLTDGSLSCIGATTYDEYRGIFSKDKALARRFQKIDVHEPSSEHALEILRGLKARYEKHHGVEYTDEALVLAVKLSARHIHDRQLPDSAVDVIDEAGSLHKSLPESERSGIIDEAAIKETVSKIARIPLGRVNGNVKSTLRTLADDLKNVVFGQDHAVDTLSQSIKRAQAGMKPHEKPVGAFLFAGPTGVGKTEVTKQLAEHLNLELIRFDMSEYMEQHTVSKLIGAPPGYSGFDQGGLLTEAINKHPYCVLLLDEVEKAHPDVFNLMLQAMDYGTMTDNNGRKADFRHVIIIMTTNAGAEDRQKRSIGFTATEDQSGENQAIKRLFTPEFRNRLDATVEFDNLQPTHMARIVDKFVDALSEQLAEKNVNIDIDREARAWIAEKGYDPAMGARPMERVMKQYVQNPLADEILFGALEYGGNVTITFNENSDDAKEEAPLHFAFKSAARPLPRREILALTDQGATKEPEPAL